MEYILKKLDEIIITLVLGVWIFTLSTHGAVEYVPNLIFQIVSIFIFCLAFYNTVFVKNKFDKIIKLFNISGYIFFLLFILYSSFQLLPFNNIFKTISVYATEHEIFNMLSYIFLFSALYLSIKNTKAIRYALIIIFSATFVTSILFILKYFGANVPIILVNPDHFSGYMSMVIPICSVFVFSNIARSERIEEQMIFLFYSLVMILALVLTMSRGGFFSFLFASLFMIILVLKNKYVDHKIWFVGIFLVSVFFIIIWFGITPFLDNLTSIKQEITSRYFAGRMPIWTATVQIIKNYFVFGTGLGTFSIVFLMFKPMSVALKYATHAHCDFMEIISDTGIIGFVLFMSSIFLFLGYLFKNFKKIKFSSDVVLSIGFFGSIFSIIFHSFFDFNLHIPSNAILLSMILALFLKLLRLSLKKIKFDEKFLPHQSVIARLFFKSRGNLFDFFASHKFFSSKLIFILIFLGLIALIIFPAKKAIAYYYYNQSTKDSNIIFAKMNLLKKAIFFDQNNPEYHYALGKIYVTSYDKEYVAKGIEKYKKAIAINSFNSQYWASLGWTYSVNGEKNKAISAFTKAIEVDQFNPYVHRNYALCLLNFLDEREKGILEYQKAVELNPNFMVDMIRLFAKKNMTIEDIYKEVLPKKPSVDVGYFLLLMRAKGVDYAINFAVKYLETYDTNAELNFRVADASFYNKKISWEITNNYYQKTLKLDPKKPEYHYWYGRHLFYVGKKQESKEQFDTAIKLNYKYKKQVNEFLEKN
jgi:tetratricopeptide (TPR) repeat protein